METLEIFGLQFVLSLFVYALLTKWYVVPWLAEKPTTTALIALLIPHATRHLGLVFLVPSVTNGAPPELFAQTAAYGDLTSGLLAIAAMIALRGNARFAIGLVWIFNLVGTVDLLNALRQAEAVPNLGAAWYIPTFWVPVLLISHWLIFSRLIQVQRARRPRIPAEVV